MSNKLPRLFFALRPDADTRQRLASIGTDLGREISREIACRAVAPDNYHLTLLFLGSVEVSMLDSLQQACKDIVAPPFRLRIDRAGWWQKPKLVWLGPLQPPDALLQLADQLRMLASQQGLAVTDDTLIPHVTLFRKVASPVELPAFNPFSWPVDEFCLMESISGPDGVAYRTLDSWPLTGTGGQTQNPSLHRG